MVNPCWEFVTEDQTDCVGGGPVTQRLTVPGGYIYLMVYNGHSSSVLVPVQGK